MNMNSDEDELMQSPVGTTMQQRLQDAVKMEQEFLREIEAAYAAAAANGIASTALVLESAAQVALQLHGDEASDFMRNVPAPPMMSGEVVPTAAERGDGEGGWEIRDTLATSHTAAIAASLERSELLSQSYIDVLALGIDAAESVGGNNLGTVPHEKQ